mmetsp:Transcript_43108/g.128753  ORF Transcript_43108/g.128753 Transcript_43108/m.128753 type:complete len:256 (-) Transcript_43108:15-782(-)
MEGRQPLRRQVRDLGEMSPRTSFRRPRRRSSTPRSHLQWCHPLAPMATASLTWGSRRPSARATLGRLPARAVMNCRTWTGSTCRECSSWRACMTQTTGSTCPTVGPRSRWTVVSRAAPWTVVWRAARLWPPATSRSRTLQKDRFPALGPRTHPHLGRRRTRLGHAAEPRGAMARIAWTGPGRAAAARAGPATPATKRGLSAGRPRRWLRAPAATQGRAAGQRPAAAARAPAATRPPRATARMPARRGSACTPLSC